MTLPASDACAISLPEAAHAKRTPAEIDRREDAPEHAPLVGAQGSAGGVRDENFALPERPGRVLTATSTTRSESHGRSHVPEHDTRARRESQGARARYRA